MSVTDRAIGFCLSVAIETVQVYKSNLYILEKAEIVSD